MNQPSKIGHGCEAAMSLPLWCQASSPDTTWTPVTPMFDFSNPQPQSLPAVFAHRGASRLHHENTLEAFQAAVDLGVDGIEFDVRRTRDNVIVVHHNARVLRSSRWIKNLSYDEILGLAKRRGYHIPTLEETLRLCSGEVALDIELKEPGYEREVVALVRRWYNFHHVAFTSFRPAVVAALRVAAPRATIGLIVGTMAPTALRARLRRGALTTRLRTIGADIVAPHRHLVTSAFCKRMADEGLPIMTWTINRTAVARRLAQRGAAVIITDVPERILPALRSMPKE